MTPTEKQGHKSQESSRSQEESEEARGEHHQSFSGSARENAWEDWLAMRGGGVIKPVPAQPGGMGSKLRSRVPFFAFSLPHLSALSEAKSNTPTHKKRHRRHEKFVINTTFSISACAAVWGFL